MSCSVPEAIRRLYKLFKLTIRLINQSSYLGRCLNKIGMVTEDIATDGLAEEPIGKKPKRFHSLHNLKSRMSGSVRK